MNCIEIKNLSFWHREGNNVVSNVCCSVRQHAHIALIGPNGSGKSTLLKLILGLLSPHEGEISIMAGHRLAYVPQMLRYDASFPISVVEVVLGGLVHALSGRSFDQHHYHQAYEALTLLAMDGAADTAFGALSHGQAQRVLVARALVSHPSILLLDEPTAHIDVASERALTALLATLTETTVLMITHDIDTILHQVHEVWCLREGVLTTLHPKEICSHVSLGLYHKE